MADVGVLGSTMRYLDSGGTKKPVLFLHGNPTSSYLWRRVLPRLDAGRWRLIAVDLIGMGGSGKPDLEYRLVEHVAYVEAFVEALGLTDVVLVGHDWGVAISLELLRRRPELVGAVAFMEGHVRPIASWDDFDPLFQQLRAPGIGEQMVLAENFFVETLLPAGMRRTLTPAELAVYRRPYPDPASRRPLLRWAREIPIEGEPADVVKIFQNFWGYLAGSPVPKLLIHGQPGAVLDAEYVQWCRRTQPGLVVADVGEASHFLPEDRPVEVAAALARWLDTV